METFAGKVTISHQLVGPPPVPIILRIRDARTYKTVVEVKMTPEDFGLCVTGQGHVNGSVVLNEYPGSEEEATHGS